MSYSYELEEVPTAADIPESGVLRLLSRGMTALNRLVLGVAMIALIGAALVLTLSVILRYFLKVPTDWQDEAAVFLLVGVTFMCGAYVQEMRGHIGIEALASLLPPAANRLRLWLCDLASFAFCAFFSWKSWTLFYEAWSEGQTTSSSWAPPLWLPYSSMAAGMTLLTVQLFLQVLNAQASKRSHH